MEYTDIAYEVSELIATITIDRPKRLTALRLRSGTTRSLSGVEAQHLPKVSCQPKRHRCRCWVLNR